MVRFAPTETGDWQLRGQSQRPRGHGPEPAAHLHRRASRRITASSASHPTSDTSRYSDGTSFYGVGLWYNDSYELFNQGQITEAGLDELKKRGVNFISFFPTPLETMGTGLGRYDENRCGRLDQLFEWCEERDIHISWNLWFHSYISEAVWGGGNARYRNNPYRLVTDAKGFFASDEAWKYQEKLHRYIIARWGYSRALFLWFVIDEINGTEGWEQGRQGGRRAVVPQDGRVLQRARSLRPAHHGHAERRHRPVVARRLQDLRHRRPRDLRSPGTPDAQERQARSRQTRTRCSYSYRNYATQTQNLWTGFAKPAMIGECGWDHTYYEPGMPGYLAMYHNALWAGLANGLCCTPFWWAHSDRLNDSVVTNQMRYFAQFVADIDFAHLDLQPAEITAGDCDAWAMKSDKLIFGWVVNPRTSVANDPSRSPALATATTKCGSTAPGAAGIWTPRRVPCRDGKLTVTIPELTTTGGHASHIGNDVAFKIVPR